MAKGTSAPRGTYEKGTLVRYNRIQAKQELEDRRRLERIQRQNRAVLTRRQKDEKGAIGTKPPLKGGYILFFLVLGLAIGKDILDIASLILSFVGMGLTATVVGAPVGAGITMFSEIVNKITGLGINLVMFTYFAFIGGRLAFRFVIMSIGAIIDFIPVLNVLPMTTFMFVVAFLVGRVLKKTGSSLLGGRIASFVAKKV